METIIYQGREIEVERIAEKEGYMGARLDGQERDGSDKLLRDDAGQYYLQRIRYNGQRPWTHSPTANNPADEWFQSIHWLSQKAAILWAIEGFPSEKPLRRDALEALKAPRNPSASRRYADGSMDISLRLKPEPARLFRAACELDEQSAPVALYEALSERAIVALGGGFDEENEYRAIFKDNAPEEAPAVPPLPPIGSFNDLLDDNARALLRERVADRPEDDPRDVLNAAVDFFLCDPDDVASPETSREALSLAKARRQEKEASSPSASRLSVSFSLDPLHSALLTVFTRRNCIDVAAFAKAAMVSELGDIFDPGQPDEERCAAECIRAYGRLNGPPDESQIEGLLKQAGLSAANLESFARAMIPTGQPTVVMLLNEDGGLWDTMQLEAELSARIQAIADERESTFGEALLHLLRQGLENLRLAEKRQESRPAGHASIAFALSGIAHHLLARYQALTGREEGDIINAALIYALKMTIPKHKAEHDWRREEGWVYFEEEVTNAALRRMGLAKREEWAEAEDSTTMPAFEHRAARPAARQMDPEDIGILAATEPIPVSEMSPEDLKEEEDDDEDEPAEGDGEQKGGK